MKQEQKESVFEEFFRKEYNKLINYVRKNVQSNYLESTPEDILQDVAVSLIARLDVDTQVENLAAYVYRSIRNKIIDYKRKPQRKVSIDNLTQVQKDGLITNEVPEDSIDDIISQLANNPALLHAAIKQLKPDEQAIIMATEFENITFDVISRKWGVPIGTLLSRKHRALSKLYKILQKEI
jgi:RNA polymerase sigma factor (sigma-70 family)